MPAAHCTAVVNKPLIARYYYLYADDGKGGWAGHHAFCVGTPGKPFRIRGRGNCALSGFERKDFFEIDTGNDTDFQQTLSD